MKVTEYLDNIPIELLSTSNGRKLVTRDDPMLFAIVYLIDHLKFEQDEPSLSEFHIALAEYGKSWITDDASKDCFIAPRSAGKTTWLFLILTLWAAAHEHLKFIAAFSDSASQATQHLQTFKHELDSNELLRKDYPELCKPLMGNNVKRHIAQSNEQIQQSNGFSFSAKGIDAKALGMKIGNRRPDLLLLDDIEPPEANYSALEVAKRLGTVLNSVFPLSIKARVAIIGTTTMSNSIIDQLRKVGEARLAWQNELEKSLHLNQDSNASDEHLKRHRLSTQVPIINNYVSLDKGTLNDADLRIGSSDAAESIDLPFGRPLTEKGAKFGSSETGGCFPVCSDIESDSSIDDLSTDIDSTIDREDGFISEPVKNLVCNDPRECLISAQKSDVKSDGWETATSTPLSRVSNFDNSESLQSRQNAELEKLMGKPQPALQEFDQQNIIEPTDFYESLDQALRWVIDEQIKVHYFPAIVVDSAGTERSLWPEFWSLNYLNSIRHTRNFYMNYLNKPTSLDAAYWSESDIPIAQLESYRYTLISVDPAIKTKAANDYTGIVVVSFGDDGKCYVRHAEQLRIVSTELKQKISDLIEKFDAKLVYCEVNQGGDLWRSVFDGIPAKFRTVHQTEKKELRAARVLDYYKKNLVFHTKNFADLEEQMFAFPKVPHDDILDAMATGVHYFLGNSQKSTARKRSYI
ncbi:hypothetical protein [Rhodococcus sp. IEGM 1379]|uniref:phage terminase large subunit family protein n=1 Tax=Rhodococcus sp. IEGM 1379 TaxID=3047086 RepID=UPI0024B7C33A|nr:hypothetical protein [Rhodococcus sp. IEGM 1379]MDI9916902.1 hypothetical protein [Rhodococcus sp. IEGM 1379]